MGGLVSQNIIMEDEEPHFCDKTEPIQPRIISFIADNTIIWSSDFHSKISKGKTALEDRERVALCLVYEDIKHGENGECRVSPISFRKCRLTRFQFG